MATFERHVDVDWKGSVMEGKGDAKAGTGAFTLPVSFPSRIGDPGGKTSPEALMAAAHAAVRAVESQLRAPQVGALTPAQAFGAGFALLVPGTRIEEL